MFGNMMKTFPAEYIFLGFNVYKSLSVTTVPDKGDEVCYDVFEYTFIDNKLSFYVLFDDGKYKNMETNEKVDLVDANNLVSRHFFRGKEYDLSKYQSYDKNKLYGVFCLRNMQELIDEIERLQKLDPTNKVNVKALFDIKSKYTGMEVNTLVNMYNRIIKDSNQTFVVPAISYGIDDEYKSLIGDEIEYFDFVSEKNSPQLLAELKDLSKKNKDLI